MVSKRKTAAPLAGRPHGARPWCASLKAAHEVEGEHAEDLPGAVGGVAHRRHAVEGEAALELAVDLLVDAAPAHEGPECRPAERLVRRDRRVFVVPVAGVEEIELEVLRRLVLHPPAVDDDAEAPPPRRHARPVLGAAHRRLDARPAARRLHPRLESQPRIEGHLDRVLGARPAPAARSRRGGKRRHPCGIRASSPPPSVAVSCAKESRAGSGGRALPSWTLPGRFCTRSTCPLCAS